MAEDGRHRANRLIAAMPAELFSRLHPHLEVVPLPPRTVLAESDSPLRHAYFPMPA